MLHQPGPILEKNARALLFLENTIIVPIIIGMHIPMACDKALPRMSFLIDNERGEVGRVARFAVALDPLKRTIEPDMGVDPPAGSCLDVLRKVAVRDERLPFVDSVQKTSHDLPINLGNLFIHCDPPHVPGPKTFLHPSSHPRNLQRPPSLTLF